MSEPHQNNVPSNPTALLQVTPASGSTQGHQPGGHAAHGGSVSSLQMISTPAPAPPLQGEVPPSGYEEQQPQAGYPPTAQAPYPPQQQMGANPQQPEGGYYPFVQTPQYTQVPPQYSQEPQPYPGQAGSVQQEVTMVSYQPMAGVTRNQTRSRPELGIGAAIFAGISTICILGLGCWWALPCSIVGIILGVTSASYGSNSNTKLSNIHGWTSIGCTSFALLFTVVGVMIIIVTLNSYYHRI